VGRENKYICIERQLSHLQESWQMKCTNKTVGDTYVLFDMIEIKSRSMRWTGHVARVRERRGVCGLLVERTEGKRPRRRWEDNIKTDLREIVIDGADWIQLPKDRFRWWAFVSTVMNLQVP
jgi:hypothetical protein